jgi:hypothetical protein
MKSTIESPVRTREPASDSRISRAGPAAIDPLDAIRGDAVQSARAECRRNDAWRHTRVAVAAYYLAERRGFQPGSEAMDWRLAELQIDAADAS